MFYLLLTILGGAMVSILMRLSEEKIKNSIGMRRKKQRVGRWEILFGVLIAIPNFVSTRFMLSALAVIPAVIAYPASSVGTILTVTLAGVLFFHERLSKRQWIGIGAILVALVLLNI